MKIVDVCGFYSETGGGVRSYVHQKFDAARGAGHQLTVIAPGVKSRTQIVRGGKIAWVKSPLMPFDANYRRFTGSREVWAVLNCERPDIVEGSSPWHSGWLAAHWPGRAARALIFHQDFVAGYPYTALSDVLPLPAIDRLFAPYWGHVRRLSARYDVTVTGGEWLAARLQSFGITNARAVPFGIEPGRFSPAKRDEGARRELLTLAGASPAGKLIIAVGRFHPEKRQPMLIEAFANARGTMPDLGLVLIGDGLTRRAVERAAARAGNVHLLGAQTDRDRLATLYASADLLIHGSGAETYGLVVAEAIASGLAVVVPRVGGAADLATGGGGAPMRWGAPANARERSSKRSPMTRSRNVCGSLSRRMTTLRNSLRFMKRLSAIVRGPLPLDRPTARQHEPPNGGTTQIATPNTLIFVDMPSSDPVAASKFYAKVFGWTDDARLPGVFHRLNPGGCIREPDGGDTKVANLQFGASSAANRRPHPRPEGPEPRTLASTGQRPRVWVLVGEGQSEAVMLETAVKHGGKVLWRNHFWAEFNGYCCSFADPWGNEFVLWSRGAPGAKALPGYTQE